MPDKIPATKKKKKKRKIEEVRFYFAGQIVLTYAYLVAY